MWERQGFIAKMILNWTVVKNKKGKSVGLGDYLDIGNEMEEWAM